MTSDWGKGIISLKVVWCKIILERDPWEKMYRSNKIVTEETNVAYICLETNLKKK